jgi:long-chain acyl-CoA synthetase
MNQTGQRVSPATALEAPTVCAAFQATATAHADAVALRTRGDATSVTWGEYAARVESVAGGLAGLGLGKGDTIATQLTNRPEFHYVDMAAAHLGALSFGIYNTSPAEEITYRLDNADCRVVVTEQQFLPAVRQAIRTYARVEHLVVVDGPAPGALTLEQVEAAGRPDFDFGATWRGIRPGDLLTIIYTSGTTGPPKGAQWTHANAVALLRAYDDALPMPRRMVSFLPMAHAGERLLGHYMPLAYGATVTCCPDPRETLANVEDAHPDFLGAPPRTWTKLRSALLADIAALPDAATREAIGRGLEIGAARVEAGQRGEELTEELVARHERAKLLLRPALAAHGIDRLRLGFIGGTLTPRDIVVFFHAAGIPLIEGYGLTEATGFGAVWPRLDDIRLGTVGRPLTGVELRLAEDGEILLRSAMNMAGYRKDPEATRAAIDPEGWLHTGDVGGLSEEGHLRIVDRKKELIINAYGKNMSPSNIENAIRVQSSLIGQVMAIGDGRPYNTALITLDLDGAAAFARAGGLPATSVEQLSGEPSVLAAVRAAVDRGNLALSRVEQVKRFTLLPVEWLPDSETMTPTMKLKRRQVLSRYADQIDALYSG